MSRITDSDFPTDHVTQTPPQLVDPIGHEHSTGQLVAAAATKEEFEALFAAYAAPQKLASGFTWTEGPTYVPSRKRVVFSDVRQNRTWAWTDDARLEEEANPSHHQNGHCLDRAGRLVACSHGLRSLLAQETDGTWTVLADAFEGKRFSSPNDVALHPGDGSLWFTDPTYGIDKADEGYGGEREQPGNFVYRLDTDGTVTAPIRDRDKPNGLAFAGEDRLLLADTGVNATFEYQVTGPDAALIGEKFRVRPGKTDGLRIGADGLIWSSAADGVHVLSADGTRVLGRILVDETVANVCFAGPESKSLFICASTSIWTIELA